MTKQRYWTGLAVCVIGLAVAAAVAFYLNYVREIPLEISAETTFITEPLTADGKRVDYFAAAESLHDPPELATDDNGFRLLVLGLGVDADVSPEVRRQIYERLGIDPSHTPPLTYEDPQILLMDYVRAESAAGTLPAGMDQNSYERELLDRLAQPWTRDDLPMLSDWLDENDAALDLVSEAVRRPVFCVPWSRTSDDGLLLSVVLQDVQRIRSFARGYTARAYFRLGMGDVDGAIDDIVSCARLGRHLQRGGMMIEEFVGVACEAIAFSTGAGSSLEHQPTEEQWQRFVDELNNLPVRTSRDQALEIERLVMLDSVQALATGMLDSEAVEMIR